MLGVIIFALGLLGEYIGRIYQQVRARPRYLVQTVLEARPGDVAPLAPAPATATVPASTTAAAGGADTRARAHSEDRDR
jgi:undecaprenyl-phosphate 4-deoxy-4-formamido-L-arabinose transferase